MFQDFGQGALLFKSVTSALINYIQMIYQITKFLEPRFFKDTQINIAVLLNGMTWP